MSNKFGIPEEELQKVQKRDQNCVYCHKKMIYPYSSKNMRDSATIEHLNFNGPFYWKEGLEMQDIVMCCGSCNASRGKKDLLTWFKSKHCIIKNINETTVSKVIQDYLKRKSKESKTLNISKT